MRKLNRMIAAGALAVPMALGASGIAVADVADVAEDSPGVPNQGEALGGNSSDQGNSGVLPGLEGDECDSGDEGLGDAIRAIFGVGDDECSDQGNSGDELRNSGDELRNSGDELRNSGDELRGSGDEGSDQGNSGGNSRGGLEDLLQELGGGGSDQGNSGGKSSPLG